MKAEKQITGIILAGGKSTRMGTDKGLISYKNKTFVEHIISAIQPFVDEIIIISNLNSYDKFELKRYDDLIKNAGPLAGIYTGLHYSHTENNLVVSCDVPLINKKILQKLIAQINNTSEVIQLKSKDKNMPLIAIYKKKCEAIFLEELKQEQRKVQKAIKKCKVNTVLIDTVLEKYTTNINTKNDLDLLE
jgi:molybdopterin-guanine dinucleotide biosynthesis protein A